MKVLVSNTIKYSYLIVFSIALVLFNCQSRADDEKANNQNKPQETNIEERKLGSPVKKNNDGPKVKITAHLRNNTMDEDQDFFIPANTKKLVIGGMPLTITNIHGLEQLKNVKQLRLGMVNYKSSDVFNAIRVLSDNLEVIIFQSCTLENIDFLESFHKLKAIVLWDGRSESAPNFNFAMNKNLEYFIATSTVFKIIRDNLTGIPKDLSTYTSKEKEDITLKIVPSPMMKMIVIDTNVYPILVTDELLSKLQNVNRIALYDMSFDAGKNDYGLLKKYKNVLIYHRLGKWPEDGIPDGYKIDTLMDFTGYEVIGSFGKS